MIKNVKIRRKIVTGVLTFGLCIVSVGANVTEIFGHGYITNSRASLAKDGINTDAGQVQYEPQSIEAIGGFPLSGPKDGEIASGGIFLELDEQTKDRWVKVPVNSGENTFTWTLTAQHRTSEWKYYITKKGWNPDKAITRNDLEEIARIDANNEIPGKKVNHIVNIPSDREGYHVVLGVWEIADTGNAFYQVIDVDIKNDKLSNKLPLGWKNIIDYRF